MLLWIKGVTEVLEASGGLFYGEPQLEPMHAYSFFE